MVINLNESDILILGQMFQLKCKEIYLGLFSCVGDLFYICLGLSQNGSYLNQLIFIFSFKLDKLKYRPIDFEHNFCFVIELNLQTIAPRLKMYSN